MWPPLPRRRTEVGAAALEFALVFPVFFLLLYGLVSYGLTFGVQIAMTWAASDAARAAVACDPTDAAYGTCVVERARGSARASLDWLPDNTRKVILGSEGAHVDVALETDPTSGTRVRVSLRYPDYPSNSLLPVLSLPGLGPVPPVPSRLTAAAVVLL